MAPVTLHPHREDYGRGFVEEYLGDLKSLEALTKAIVEGSAEQLKYCHVNPNGTTRARTLAEAPNGAIVQGSEGDVSVLQLNKFNDFRTAQATMNGITDRLSQAFLLTSGVVRDAERVTAEEIRMLSQELEAAPVVSTSVILRATTSYRQSFDGQDV